MTEEKRTVLMVDDEKLVLDVQVLMMEKMGFNTIRASSPDEIEKDNIDRVTQVCLWRVIMVLKLIRS